MKKKWYTYAHARKKEIKPMGTCWSYAKFCFDHYNSEKVAIEERKKQRELHCTSARCCEFKAIEKFICKNLARDSPYKHELEAHLTGLRKEIELASRHRTTLLAELEVQSTFSAVTSNTVMRKGDTKRLANQQRARHKERMKNAQKLADKETSRNQLLAEQMEDTADTTADIIDDLDSAAVERLEIALDAAEKLKTAVEEEEEDDELLPEDAERELEQLGKPPIVPILSPPPPAHPVAVVVSPPSPAPQKEAARVVLLA